jgi:hypothetical protein
LAHTVAAAVVLLLLLRALLLLPMLLRRQTKLSGCKNRQELFRCIGN